MIIKQNKLLIIIIEPKTIYFDLVRRCDNNMKHEIDFVTKHNDFLADYTTKTEVSGLLSKN